MKKVLSLVLAAMMVVGMTTVAFADGASPVPTGWKIVGFSDNAASAWEEEEIDPAYKAGDEIDLKITAGMFKWQKQKGDNKIYDFFADADNDDAEVPGPDFAFTADSPVRASQLKDIGFRRVYQKGTAGTIDTVALKDSDSLLRVSLVDFYTKTSTTDVVLKLALTYKGSTKNAPEIEMNFEVKNEKEIIEEGQTEAYSFGNVYLEADATVRNVEFQGDDDGIVYATKTVVKGQKYYFNVDSELSDEDAQIVADNPEVDSIYNVYQTNMANATVQFKNLDREFFVYNEDGKLLGTTKDKKLPLAKKYILTTAKVDFGGAEEEPTEEPVEEPTEPEAPPMGGGEVVETPNTYNPNTGL